MFIGARVSVDVRGHSEELGVLVRCRGYMSMVVVVLGVSHLPISSTRRGTWYNLHSHALVVEELDGSEASGGDGSGTW